MHLHPKSTDLLPVPSLGEVGTDTGGSLEIKVCHFLDFPGSDHRDRALFTHESCTLCPQEEAVEVRCQPQSVLQL